MNYSNPRMSLLVNDWPYGKLRTTVQFTIEPGKKGERASRTTINPKTGKINKPKTTTYAKKARIVDGDDSKTYIAELSEYGHICIMQSNLQYQQESIHPGDDDYQAAINLFN